MNSLGSCLNLPEGLRGVKVDSDSQKVFDGADYDRVSCGHKESQCTVETDMEGESGPSVEIRVGGGESGMSNTLT